MIANYHTHTFRCHHAKGTEREYIERAIENGIKIMGFSDHIPFRFPDGFESGYRVEMKDAEDYVRTISALRDEYKNDIEIHIGWECEYYPLYFDKMLANAVSWGSEYLILGQHFIGNEHPGGRYVGDGASDGIAEYADCVTEGIKSGRFSYVCHPDVFRFSGDAAVYDREMRRICRASKEYDVPLEINFLGIRDSRHYPNDAFWKIAGEEGCTAVFGFDAHNPEAAFDGESMGRAMQIVNDYGLKLAETVNLKPLK